MSQSSQSQSPAAPASRTGGEALVDRLKAHGVDSIFLVPGIQLDWAVDALAREPSIRAYVPRHEQTVSYMADGYARVTGRPGVGMVVPGPGVLNAGAGLSTAYACNSPVVLLAGQVHSGAVGKGFGNLHELKNQTAVLEAVTKWTATVTDRGQIEGLVDDAFARAMHGRRRPVAVELPYDLLIAKAGVAAATHPSPPPPPHPETTRLDEAARLIDQAALPVIYVGGGAMRAGAEVAALAERIGAPVVASDNGRGCIPDSHPLSFTALGGRVFFARADVVLVVGSRFMDAMTPEPSWEQAGVRYIYLNIDAADAEPPRQPAVFLHGDAGAGLAELCQRVRRRTVVSADQAARVKAWERDRIRSTGDLYRYCTALRAALPDDGIFVNELTQVGYLCRIGFEVRQPGTMIGPGYQGTLGYSFPTALGAAVAAAGRRVLAITGDGGFGWSLQELATARRYDLPVTLVVFNDGHFGNVRAIQRRTFGREFGVALENPAFDRLAQAFSIPYVKAGDPASLEGVLKEVAAQDGPVLVEAPVGEMPSPWPLLRLKPMPGAGGAEIPDDLL